MQCRAMTTACHEKEGNQRKPPLQQLTAADRLPLEPTAVGNNSTVDIDVAVVVRRCCHCCVPMLLRTLLEGGLCLADMRAAAIFVSRLYLGGADNLSQEGWWWSVRWYLPTDAYTRRDGDRKSATKRRRQRHSILQLVVEQAECQVCPTVHDNAHVCPTVHDNAQVCPTVRGNTQMCPTVYMRHQVCTAAR